MTDVSTPRLATLIERLDPARGVQVGPDWEAGASGTFDVHDPATGEVITAIADADPAQGLRAVAAAHAAQPEWAARSPRDRAEALRRVYDAMIDDADMLAELIAAENGKSLADARGEVTYAAEFFRWFGEEAVRIGGRYGEAPAGGAHILVTHRPVGVAALVTPWNFPAAMGARKIAPALAAGCTVVLKPAAETPLTALAMARIITEAGIPDGVVNVVPTSDAGSLVSAWLADERVRKLSFTGSTGVGRTLLEQCAQRVVNASMELGGNAPFVVADDADVAAAVEGALVAKFRGGGQACTAANRFLVHADVVDEFNRLFAERITALEVGAASEDGVDVGPLINDKAVQRISALIDDAVARGARIAAQADVPEQAGGYFLAPTLLVDVPRDADVVTEEIFGPVAPVLTWRDEDELVDLANATEMGLSAYVYSRDLQRAMRLSARIEAGMVGINRGLVSDPAAPFGGFKQSGLGREGAREGIEEYQETQYMSIDWSNTQ